MVIKDSKQNPKNLKDEFKVNVIFLSVKKYFEDFIINFLILIYHINSHPFLNVK